MLHKLVFYTGFSTLLAHELDAVAHAEWRVLPLTSFLPDHIGYAVFVVMHIPLLVGLLWLLCESSQQVHERTRLVVAGFLVLHLILHRLFEGHEHYDFYSSLSVGLIQAAAALGLLYLLMAFVGRYKTVK